MSTQTSLNEELPDIYYQFSEFDQTSKQEMAVPSEYYKGNLVYLAAISELVIEKALEIFRYRSNDDFYSDGDILGINFWQLAHHDIINYSELTIGATLTLTQMLSMNGLGSNVNISLFNMVNNYIMPFIRIT